MSEGLDRHPPARSPTCPPVRPFARSPARPLARSPARPLARPAPPTRSLTRPPVRSLTCHPARLLATTLKSRPHTLHQPYTHPNQRISHAVVSVVANMIVLGLCFLPGVKIYLTFRAREKLLREEAKVRLSGMQGQLHRWHPNACRQATPSPCPLRAPTCLINPHYPGPTNHRALHLRMV